MARGSPKARAKAKARTGAGVPVRRPGRRPKVAEAVVTLPSPQSPPECSDPPGSPALSSKAAPGSCSNPCLQSSTLHSQMPELAFSQFPPQVRVQKAQSVWDSLGDSYVSQVISQGLKLDWIETPPFVPVSEFGSHPLPPAVDDIIAKWVQEGFLFCLCHLTKFYWLPEFLPSPRKIPPTCVYSPT